MRCFFDLETTGFSKKDKVIELGYIIYNNNNMLIKKNNIIIKPINFVIKNTRIHGITQTHAFLLGTPLINALKTFYKDTINVKCFMAHNMAFDKRMLLQEVEKLRHKDDIIQKLYQKIKNTQFLCLMLLVQKMFGQKYKLQVLYKNLFNKSAKQEHRALSDARLVADCYYKLFDQKYDRKETIKYIRTIIF